MKTQPHRGSHLPVLIRFLPLTRGPILELGCGMYSTPFIHWAAYPYRRVVTYESNPDYYGFLNHFEKPFHEVHCITDWDTIDISEPWGIAFVDHAPDERRVKEIKRLTHAEYVIVHDADNKTARKYRYSTIFSLFKYRYKYSGARPATLVLSNKHKL